MPKIKCKVEGCNYEAHKLTKHVKIAHGFSKEEYIKKYGNALLSEEYKEKIRANGRQAIKSIDSRIYKHECKIEGCKNIITNKNLICASCKMKGARKNQEQKFQNLIENIDYVRCKCKLENGEICNWPEVRLSKHIKHHGYNSQEYKREFGKYSLTCSALRKKVGFKGKHSEKTKKLMSDKRKGKSSWNKGLTKYDHSGLMSISNKAALRMSQLINNNWHTNPVKGERSGNYGKHTWAKGMTKNNSELIEKQSESNTGKFHHKSSFGIMMKNDFVYKYLDEQKIRLKKAQPYCYETKIKEKLIVHHIIPTRCFDFYDLSAHDYSNLIVLNEKIHNSIAQNVDKALIHSNLKFNIM